MKQPALLTRYLGFTIYVTRNNCHPGFEYEWRITKDGKTQYDPTSWPTLRDARFQAMNVIDFYMDPDCKHEFENQKRPRR